MMDQTLKIKIPSEKITPELVTLLADLPINPVLKTIKSKYHLDDNTSMMLDGAVYLMLTGIKNFVEFDEEMSSLVALKTETAQNLVDETLDFVTAVSDKFDLRLGTPEMSTSSAVDEAISKEKIMAGIENPQPSAATYIRPATAAPKLNTAKPVINGVPTLGGFTPAAPAVHPATPVAEKLNQKLSTPSSSAPKEIYQIKRNDPYHEQIEP